MAVAAISEYKFPMKDAVENFHGSQLVFIGWDKHLMFYARAAFPLPPQMKFSDLFGGPLAQYYSQHPDFEKIDWSTVTWMKDGKPFKPDYDKSLAENGIGHKDLLRFQTPGLDGLFGSCF
jgi:phenol/toluene 2-monooxygenase (NADH) P4/A4